MVGIGQKVALEKRKKAKLIDIYELYVEFEGKKWVIKEIDFNNSKITIEYRSVYGITKLIKHFNEVELLEYGYLNTFTKKGSVNERVT